MIVLDGDTRLPLPLSSFVNRQEEIEALRNLLTNGARLITLTGPGGTGKTRLALQIASLVFDSTPDGVFFVPLEGLFDPEQVLPAIAKALNVPESGERSTREELILELAGKRLLLILDNFEHLLPATSQVMDLVRACPGLHLFVTSREALRVSGEQEFPVYPLDLPSSTAQDDFDVIVRSPAIQLFMDRARAVRPEFKIDNQNVFSIVEICQILDGLPLAIELAASLLRLFSPQALQARLEGNSGLKSRSQSMQLLAGGPRDLPVRQQTLRSTIDWSYHLLDSAEQRVFRSLSVFSGGCTIEAAEMVCLNGTEGVRPILDYLIPLVEKNLIRSEKRDGEPRFRLLRTIREYTLEQLHGQGEYQAVQGRYARYYLEMAEHAENQLKGPDQSIWLERLEQEQDNLRAVLGWSLDTNDVETAFRLGGALWRFWLMHGHVNEGRGWVERILTTNGDIPTEIKAKVLNGAGALAWSQGDYEISRKFHTECLELRKKIEDVAGVAGSFHNLGVIALFQNDLELAASHFNESIALYSEAKDQWGVADSLIQLGSVFRNQENFDGALQYTEKGLAILRELGDTQGVAGSSILLGVIALDQGSDELAHQYFMEGKSLFAELGDRWGISVADFNLGEIALHQKNFQLAGSFYKESLILRREMGDKKGIAYCLEGLACLAVEGSAVERGARLFSAAKSLRNSVSAPLSEGERASYEPYIERACIYLGEESFAAIMKSGGELSTDQVIQVELTALERDEKRRGQQAQPHPAGLTKREVEVLRLVAEGLSDARIAEELVISPRTVNAHITSIYSKLGVKSRATATHLAIDEGLV